MWFKLIAGASHTDVETITNLVSAYASANIDCIDVACRLDIVNAVQAVLETTHHSPQPLLMVSIALDSDSHFQKITLTESDCILCGACVLLCPAEALELGPNMLMVSHSKCYGCNRCIPVCPTEALQLHPFSPDADLVAVLSHPMVSAVEIHTRDADLPTLQTLLTCYESLFRHKKVSVCFSPYHTQQENWLACLDWLVKTRDTFDWMLQIDGQPMSGSSHPEASRPALDGAQYVHQTWQDYTGQVLPFLLTVSGGINHETANLLPAYPIVQGVAVGTVARQWIKQGDHPMTQAAELVNLFKKTSMQ